MGIWDWGLGAQPPPRGPWLPICLLSGRLKVHAQLGASLLYICMSKGERRGDSSGEHSQQMNLPDAVLSYGITILEGMVT